ncbi:MAG TPA: Ku protein [Gemmatimonadaceae bacterium]|jgi:DNA end-binding protein Ku|nr:Ku protein [Gemmatimonadaceae bacterium]
MATIWKGSLTFGLLSVPVTVKRALADSSLRFRLLHDRDHAPIELERVCSVDGETVPWRHVVKGYEYRKGKFVVLTDADFRDAALASAPTIDLGEFVPAGDIDPRYFDTPYFLMPGEGGDAAYVLLREALRKTKTVGIGTIILRQREHVAGVTVVDDALILEIMRFERDVLPSNEYGFPATGRMRSAELDMAEELIQSMTAPFNPGRIADRYRANVMKIIKARMKGAAPRLAAAKPGRQEARVLDLMERLQQSLAKRGATGKPARTGSTGAARPPRTRRSAHQARSA